MKLTKKELTIVLDLLNSTWEKRPLTDEEALLYMNIKKTLSA